MAAMPIQETMNIIYTKFDTYPFSADTQFQAGLNSILSSAPSDDSKLELELKAKIYYFARKFSIPPFSSQEYQSWKSQQSQSSSKIDQEQSSAKPAVSSSAEDSQSTTTESAAKSEPQFAEPNDEDDHPPRLTYAELVELIQSGAPIPGIKNIPDTVLSGQGTEAIASKRRKPWEKDGADANVTADATTTHSIS